MNQLLRQEEKYLLTLPEAAMLADRLKVVLSPDIHNRDIEGYRVRSLYFDTPDNRDYHEKVDGVAERRKFRLRIYDPDARFAMLELKQKWGQTQQKRSVAVPRSAVPALTSGNYSPLLLLNNGFAEECYAALCAGCYRPKAVIEFTRLAFTARENNIRVTFDRDLRATNANVALFDKQLSLTPVADASIVLLEVKYSGFLLNYITDLLRQVNRISRQASKYCLSRSDMLGYF